MFIYETLTMKIDEEQELCTKLRIKIKLYTAKTSKESLCPHWNRLIQTL